jgi:hypothetical protein
LDPNLPSSPSAHLHTSSSYHLKVTAPELTISTICTSAHIPTLPPLRYSARRIPSSGFHSSKNRVHGPPTPPHAAVGPVGPDSISALPFLCQQSAVACRQSVDAASPGTLWDPSQDPSYCGHGHDSHPTPGGWVSVGESVGSQGD